MFVFSCLDDSFLPGVPVHLCVCVRVRVLAVLIFVNKADLCSFSSEIAFLVSDLQNQEVSVELPGLCVCETRVCVSPVGVRVRVCVCSVPKSSSWRGRCSGAILRWGATGRPTCW